MINSFKLIKKFAIIVLFTLMHFGLSVLIVAVSMSVATAVNEVQPEPSFTFRILVWATRVLHFPIISMSLYSRQWFPGNWIYVPMLANSFLWAAGIYLLYILGKKIREITSNGK